MVPCWMSLKEVKRTAAVAWSPPLHTLPMLATGTLAGALDASFSTLAELEIHDLQLEDKSFHEPAADWEGSLIYRFNRLEWSAHNGDGTDGVIIGGFEDGAISFWNASLLLSSPKSDAALVARCDAHHGAVRGLQVNPFQPFLVASGATDAEVWLWDLNNLNQPYSPAANKSTKLEDITDLAWNRIVPHILATASNSGHTVVWDLKSRKEVLQLSAPGQRVSMSAIAWNPENATQILVASDDDQSPIVYSWDLRNARAPEKTLVGHSKGILSLAWCPKDAELLLSCGKDNKSICWNPKTGSIVSELTQSDNWLFDIQWCPRNPDLFSTASFSGQVEVHSFQGLMSGSGRATAQASNPNDFFAAASLNATSRVAPPAHVQIPKWLRRPIGVSFGFGGRLVTFSAIKPETVRTVSIVTLIVSAAEKLVQESTKLDAALSSQTLVDYCAAKIPSPILNLHGSDGEAIFWNVAKVMFESNPSAKLLNLLGFDKAELEDKLRSLSISSDIPRQPANGQSPKAAPPPSKLPLLSTVPETTLPSSNIDDFFSSGAEKNDFDFQSLVTTATANAPTDPEVGDEDMLPSDSGNLGSGCKTEVVASSASFPLFAPESLEIDQTIMRAIILGNFEGAVDLCVSADRLSDALLVAICGGERLVAKTQQLYFKKSRFSYLRVVSGIVKKDLSDVVENAHIENWEEILAIICSYTDVSTFSHLCNVLAARIEAKMPQDSTLATPALICYMAAGNSAKAISLVLSQQVGLAPQAAEFFKYSLWLEGLIEKVRILEQVAGYVAPQEALPAQDTVPEISDKFIEYSYIMANSGLLEIAVRYFNSFSNDRQLGGQEDLVVVFGDQLAKATSGLSIPIRPVPEAFEVASLPLETVKEDASALAPANSAAAYAPPHPDTFNQARQWSPLEPSTHQPQPQPQTQHQHQHQYQYQYQAQPQAQYQGQPQPQYQNHPQTPAAFPPSNSFSTPAAASLSSAAPSFARVPPPPAPISSAPSFSHHAPPHNMAQPSAPPAPHFPPQSSSMVAAASSFAQPLYNAPQAGTAVLQPAHFAPQFSTASSAQPSFSNAPAQSFPAPPVPPILAAEPQAHPQQYQQQPMLRPSLVPLPPRPNATPPPPASLSSAHPQDLGGRRPAGAYNDPPMVAPRAPSTATLMERPPMMRPAASEAPSATPAAQPAASAAPASKSSPGPVDPSLIPANLQPIYRTFNTLITQCQERAMPMQRRVIEDSARRMQSLFGQLAGQELSTPVVEILNEMCSRINRGQYDQAHELHMPLMTNYFTEAGAWVLAAKRLVEVAKICLH